MKKTILFLMTIGLLTFQSCCVNYKTADTRIQTTELSLLAGKIYCYSDPPHSDTCEYVPVGTDFYSEYLFLDNSSFVEILHTCCGEIGEKDWGEDFAAETYFPGKYKLNETELILNYEPKVVVFYFASKNNPKSDTILSKTHVEIEKSDTQTIKFTRINCKNRPYFIYKNEESQTCIAQTKDTLQKYIDEIRKEKVWDKLFNKN
jgi:hypothetical protein